MKFCPKCGAEIADDMLFCPNCGSQAEKNQTQPVDDQAGAGLCFLSFLIPLFGIIYWIAKHKESPNKAKTCGVISLISWIVYIILI